MLLLAGLVAVARGRLVTFDNTKPRLDVNNTIINAHDGTTRRYEVGGEWIYHVSKHPRQVDLYTLPYCRRTQLSHPPSFLSAATRRFKSDYQQRQYM